MSDELKQQGLKILFALENQFKIRASEIQRISTGDLPIEKADIGLIRNLAQYQAIKNGMKVADRLERFITP